MRWHELTALQAHDLDRKVELARSAIAEAFAVAHRPALAFSAGKDSTVLRDMILRFFPDQARDLIVIWGNTGVEYPECIKFAHQVARETPH